MRFLVDTPVLSELVRKVPDPGVANWVKRASPEQLYVSVVTFGELTKGIAKLPDGQRKGLLLSWVETELKGWFGDRILEVGLEVAERWGLLLAKAERKGRPLPAVDALLAATALVHGLVLVTRNTRHFEAAGLEVLNPWSDAQH